MSAETYVIDASVGAKWVLPPDREQFSEAATQLFRRHAAGQVLLIVPDLFWSEMGNILWKAARVGRMTAQAATAAFARLTDFDLQTVPSTRILHSALQIAIRFQRSFYDSVYAALAEISGHPLLTADERLANAVAAYLPVKWLGAI